MTFRTVIILSILLATIPVAAAADTAEEPDIESGMLLSATWRYKAWGREVEGLACWLRGTDGSWRLEVTTEGFGEGTPPIEPLLTWEGEGWTVVSGSGDSLYLQPWRDRIDELTPEQAGRVAMLVVLAEHGRAATVGSLSGVSLRHERARRNAARLPWRDGASTGREYLLVDWGGTDEGTLLAAMEKRALGRGAAGETWRVEFDGERDWRLISTRRSGRLTVRALPSTEVAYFPDEVFLPLWPLVELLSRR